MGQGAKHCPGWRARCVQKQNTRYSVLNFHHLLVLRHCWNAVLMFICLPESFLGFDVPETPLTQRLQMNSSFFHPCRFPSCHLSLREALSPSQLSLQVSVGLRTQLQRIDLFIPGLPIISALYYLWFSGILTWHKVATLQLCLSVIFLPAKPLCQIINDV